MQAYNIIVGENMKEKYYKQIEERMKILINRKQNRFQLEKPSETERHFQRWYMSHSIEWMIGFNEALEKLSHFIFDLY